MQHKSVLTKEIIENLSIQPDGIYVDLTLGAGGHSNEILNRLKNGKLISFDIDRESISKFIDLLGIEIEFTGETVECSYGGNTVILVNRNFERLAETVSDLKIEKVDGIIADLGWAIEQLERVPGLSFENSQALDMRFDQNLSVRASDLLNALGKKELLKLFEEFADIRGKQALALVDGILRNRQQKPFSDSADLTQVISELPAATRRASRIDSLPARVFQALRIAVNSELSTLQSVLPQAWNTLKLNGVVEFITFHSGEERIVSTQFTSWVLAGKAENLFAQGMQRPGVDELMENLRARSAKLFAIRKTHE